MKRAVKYLDTKEENQSVRLVPTHIDAMNHEWGLIPYLHKRFLHDEHFASIKLSIGV